MKKILLVSLFIIFCAGILALSVRGIRGNPKSESINQAFWKDDGPLELSPERGRFALLFSLVEDKSFHFSVPIARFATPDLGYANDKYVSLFAPGVSFIIIPGYILGKSVGIAQVGSFATISFFALLNVLFLRSIAIRLGANPLAASIGSLAYIFATPAFIYAVSLFQHHISTFLILSSIYILLRWKNNWSLLVVWFMAAASIPVDYPNLFLMFPIGLYALGRIIVIQFKEKGINVDIKLVGVLTFSIIVLPLSFFLWFNKMSYGSPLQLSGTVPSVKAIDFQGKPTAPKSASGDNLEKLINPEKQQKSAIRAFNPRNTFSGLYTHLISPDRGILVFTPVILFGIIGIFILYGRKSRILALLLGIVGTNVLLYSMWGDPYGGWAFGSRYLVPSYAIMSIFIALTITHFRKNSLLLLIFFIVLGYSIGVNTLGAITSSRNPPKVEALPLEQVSGVEEKYTYARNIDYLKSNRSKSFIFQTYASNNISAGQYYLIVTSLIILASVSMLIYLRFFINEDKHDKI